MLIEHKNKINLESYLNNKQDSDFKLITKLLDRPECYLSKSEKWTLLGVLLEVFGAAFDIKNNTLILYWGVEDNKYLTFIQKLLNSIIGSNCRSYYSEENGIWSLEFN